MNALKGYIWVIRWCWYGYGSVDFDHHGRRLAATGTIVLHRFTQVRPSISVPNLPMTITLNSGRQILCCACHGSQIFGAREVHAKTRMGSVQKVVTSADVMVRLQHPEEVGTARPRVEHDRYPGHLGDCFQSGHGDPTDRCCMGGSWCYDDHETVVQYDDSAAATGTTIEKGAVRSHAKMAAMCNCLDFYLTEEDVSVFVEPASVGGRLWCP
jgi:hypothetical protein